MRRFTQWLYAFGAAALLGGCFNPDTGDAVGGTDQEDKTAGPSSEMAPSFLGAEVASPDFAMGRLSTRSLVDKETTVKLSANFLRVDEDVKYDPSNPTEHHRGLYTFNDGDSRYEGAVNWEEAYLLEATLMSSPDNSPERLRSVFLEPVQSYKIRVVPTDLGGGVIQKDTTDFYHTRMVSWYPMNCRVPRTQEGTAASVKFGEGFYDQTGIVTERDVDDDGNNETVMAIQFRNLDGKTDVMVSDVKEAQYWHFDDGVHRSDFMPTDESKTGESIYASPYGHFEQAAIPNVQREISYHNHFTYKHYLSAIRVFAYAEQSQQNLTMWGEIESVIVHNQPTSVKVWLPSEEGVWGEAFDWGDYDNLYTCGDPIYGEYDSNSDMPETATFPISLRGVDSNHESYLGYALVQPERDITLQLHTTSGIYEVTIPAIYEYTEEGEEHTADILKAGYIYNVHLNLQTSGSIAALLEKDHEYVYYDLTRLLTYENPNEGEGGVASQGVEIYKYANCYICSPLHTLYTDPDTGTTRPYDGFCFSATVLGNGEAGVISQGAQSLYPTDAHIHPSSARLLWESGLGLVTDVELIYSYVRFRTPNPSREGNAVVGVFDEDDNLLWSWHIWLTDPPQDQTYDNGDNDIVMLDRNLGATAATWTDGDESTALPTYGLYYQWGRKDPSMGPSTYNYLPQNLVTAPYYDYSSRERTAAEVAQFARPTLQNAVENPMFLILPSSQSASNYYYNWLDERIDFLWGYDAATGMMTKTIYDPCPFGYRVPLGEMTTIFSNATNSNGTDLASHVTIADYGMTLENNGNTFWFPFAGFKGADKGLMSLVMGWKYVGEKGDYMSAGVNLAPGSEHYHRSRSYISRVSSWTETTNLAYYANAWVDYTNRRAAGSVRCVKNDVIGTLDLLIEPSTFSALPNEDVVINCSARSAESYVTTALVTVQNLATLETRTLYATPAGTTETTNITWEKELTFHVGSAGDAFFSPDGYKLTLTCYNSVGASNIVSTIVNVSDVVMDLSAWEAADDAKLRLFASMEHTRQFVINTGSDDIVPTSVTVTYVDGGNAVVEDATLVRSEGGKHTYEVSFFIGNAGTVEFSVSAVCPYAHTHTQTHSATYVFEAGYRENNGYFYPSDADTGWEGYRWAYWEGEDIGFDWSASSNSGNIESVTFSTDTNGVVATVSVDPASTKASGLFVFDSEYVEADVDGYFSVTMIARNAGGGEVYNKSHTLWIYRSIYDGWDGDKSAGTDFVVGLVLQGGREPQSASLTINNTTYNLNRDTSYTDNTGSGRSSKTRWTTTLNLAEGTYNGTISVVVSDGHANTFTLEAPTLVVSN